MNEKENYAIGDIVRLVFESYFDMAKCDYSQLYNIDPSNFHPDLLDLGGVYTIRNFSLNKWGIRIYEIRNCQDSFRPAGQETANHLRLLDYAPDCIYSLNDIVRFHPSSLHEKDLDLPFLNDILASQEPLIINRIIMGFYVLVQRQNGSVLDFPIKWTDLSVA